MREASREIAAARHAWPVWAEFLETLSATLNRDGRVLANMSDVIVVTHATDLFRLIVEFRPRGVHVLDLVLEFRNPPRDATCHGIVW